jgi:hypothetical protein
MVSTIRLTTPAQHQTTTAPEMPRHIVSRRLIGTSRQHHCPKSAHDPAPFVHVMLPLLRDELRLRHTSTTIDSVLRLFFIARNSCSAVK